MAGKEIRVTERGLELVESHLQRYPAPENTAMIQRLRTALQSGQKVTGADASFYMHELAERTMMARGMPYEVAHPAALAKYQVSPYSVYHPEVIRALPGDLSPNFKEFWGILE